MNHDAAAPRRRTPALALLLLGSAVILPATAATAAGTPVLVDGGVLRITGTAASESIYITVDSTTSIEVWNSSGEVAVGAGCQFTYTFSKNTATCTSAGFSSIVVRAGDGNDYVQVSESYKNPPPLDAKVYLGPGDDGAVTGGGDDLIEGEGGNDKQFNGGAGADTLRGGPGDDSGFVGDGNGNGWDATRFFPDVIDGGAGFDTASEGRLSSDGRAHFWTLDGRANDGADLDRNVRNGAEEGDNLIDIERVDGSTENEKFVGNDRANVFYGYSGQDVFDGRGGDDEIYTGLGRGIVDAGPGDDTVVASGIIELGPGRDSLSAGGGNDIVFADDGDQDLIDCGVGADILYADQTDVVTNDLSSCEVQAGRISSPRLEATAITMRVLAADRGRTTVTFVERGGLRTSTTVNVRQPGRAIAVRLPIPAGDQARLAAAGKVTGTVTTKVKVAGIGMVSASRRVTAKR